MQKKAPTQLAGSPNPNFPEQWPANAAPKAHRRVLSEAKASAASFQAKQARAGGVDVPTSAYHGLQEAATKPQPHVSASQLLSSQDMSEHDGDPSCPDAQLSGSHALQAAAVVAGKMLQGGSDSRSQQAVLSASGLDSAMHPGGKASASHEHQAAVAPAPSQPGQGQVATYPLPAAEDAMHESSHARGSAAIDHSTSAAAAPAEGLGPLQGLEDQQGAQEQQAAASDMNSSPLPEYGLASAASQLGSGVDHDAQEQQRAASVMDSSPLAEHGLASAASRQEIGTDHDAQQQQQQQRAAGVMESSPTAEQVLAAGAAMQQTQAGPDAQQQQMPAREMHGRASEESASLSHELHSTAGLQPDMARSDAPQQPTAAQDTATASSDEHLSASHHLQQAAAAAVAVALQPAHQHSEEQQSRDVGMPADSLGGQVSVPNQPSSAQTHKPPLQAQQPLPEAGSLPLQPFQPSTTPTSASELQQEAEALAVAGLVPEPAAHPPPASLAAELARDDAADQAFAGLVPEPAAPEALDLGQATAPSSIATGESVRLHVSQLHACHMGRYDPTAAEKEADCLEQG